MPRRFRYQPLEMRKSQAKLQADSFRSSACQPLPSAPSTAATLPSPHPRLPPPPTPLRRPGHPCKTPAPALHTQAPACPEEMLVPWKPGHVSFNEATGKRGHPNAHPRKNNPGIPPVGLPITPGPWVQSVPLEKEGEPNPARPSVRRRQGPTWTCFTSSSTRLGRSALLRQGGNNASKSILGHRPAWSPTFCTQGICCLSRQAALTRFRHDPMAYVSFAIYVISSTSSSDLPVSF